MIEIKSEQDLIQVLQKHSVVVLDMYADWCAPCKMLNPILSGLQNKYRTTVRFAKLNVETGIRPDVTALPQVETYINGTLYEIMNGVNEEQLDHMIQNALQMAGPQVPKTPTQIQSKASKKPKLKSTKPTRPPPPRRPTTQQQQQQEQQQQEQQQQQRNAPKPRQGRQQPPARGRGQRHPGTTAPTQAVAPEPMTVNGQYTKAFPFQTADALHATNGGYRTVDYESTAGSKIA